MKEKNTASPTILIKRLKLGAILAILLLIGVMFLSVEQAENLRQVDGGDDSEATFGELSKKGASPERIKSLLTRTVDYEIEIVSTGFVDENGVYIESNIIYPNLLGAYRVKVSNNARSGKLNWHIESKLPTKTNFRYISEDMEPLRRGEEKTFLLKFNDVTSDKVSSIITKVVHDENEKVKENNTDVSVVSIVE